MPELRTLIRSFGRRPCADGTDLKKYPPQRETSDEAPLGVIRSPFAPMETKGGVRKSDVIEGLLPPELLLLAAFRSNHTEERNSSGAETRGSRSLQAAIGLRRRKLLFLAKKAEKALGSYERSGWLDTHSLPARRWRYQEKTPTHVGGPVIICLDTSGSMAGSREHLAKAVVLETAIMVTVALYHSSFDLIQHLNPHTQLSIFQAGKDGRVCYVITFSGYGTVAEFEGASVGVKNKTGLARLLDFLAYSFHGSTDLTRPLKRAIELVEQNEGDWTNSDILLVTDGVFGAVQSELMNKLGQLEVTKGLEIHGLLVGNTESAPLAALCTDWDGQNRLHSFLVKNEADIQEQRSVQGQYGAQYEYGRSGADGKGASRLFSSSVFSTTSFRRARGRHSLRLSAYVKSKSDVGNFCEFIDTPKTIDNPNGYFINYQFELDGVTRKLVRIERPGDDGFVGVFEGRNAAGRYMEWTRKVVKVNNRWMTYEHTVQMNQSQRLYCAAEAEARAMIDRIAIGHNASRHKQRLKEEDMGGVIQQALAVLQTGLIEREVEVKLLLLTVLCREHILVQNNPTLCGQFSHILIL